MKHRLERVCKVLQRELGVLILREITLPTPLVTISSVDITPDLKQAHIFISALGTPAQKRGVLTALEHNRVLLQAELAKRIVMKNTPHLHFKLDDSIERGTRVLGILDELHIPETEELPPEERP